MLMMDYTFFYKYTIRSLLMHKCKKIKNTLEIPLIMKIYFTFPLRRISDIDDKQVYNYLYLLKFYFGQKGSLTKLKSFYNLGK